MPALPKSLRRPHPWLAAALAFWGLVGLDWLRPPEDQLSAKGYHAAVSVYRWAKPKLGFKASCRYSPSCSHYSTQAVEEHGMVRGLILTVQRLQSCTTDVPKGTVQPVPPREADGGP